jgi:hypothetical protein
VCHVKINSSHFPTPSSTHSPTYPPPQQQHTHSHTHTHTHRQGGYLGDRHCFGPSCAWGETRKETKEIPTTITKPEEEKETPAHNPDPPTTTPTPTYTHTHTPTIPYRLYQWDLLSSFIYFSHHFLTIPPPAWITHAHTHHTRALGTFITEWGEGKIKCKDLFSKDAETDTHTHTQAARLADVMVEMCVYYGFDGWLVNIENEVDWEGGTEVVVFFLLRLVCVCVCVFVCLFVCINLFFHL